MSIKTPIFMDYHSTTPCDPRVVDAMLPYFTEKFGNAASRSHPFGWTAEAAVDAAREKLAAVIGAGSAKEIVLTSGATESTNLALKGAYEFYEQKGRHIITSAIEHKATLDTCKRLEKAGAKVTYLPVERDGRVDPARVADAITSETTIVSIMHVNNEIGTIQPIEEIGKITRERGVLLHVDAAQAVGKIACDVNALNVDLMSFTAHKMYGPKGVGALYVRRARPRVRLVAQMDGGGHERGMRSGTLNVPAIVGFGKAAELALAERTADASRILSLRERLRTKITDALEEVYINGSLEHRVAGNLNLSFNFVEGEAMMMGIKDVAVSSGSACTSASLEPSYVLRALGVGDELAHSSIRFGLGKYTTEEEVDYVAEHVIAAVSKLRDLSPLYEMHKEGIDLATVEWQAH